MDTRAMKVEPLAEWDSKTRAPTKVLREGVSTALLERVAGVIDWDRRGSPGLPEEPVTSWASIGAFLNLQHDVARQFATARPDLLVVGRAPWGVYTTAAELVYCEDVRNAAFVTGTRLWPSCRA